MRPIRTFTFSAPRKDDPISAKTYAESEMIPMYLGLQHDNPNYTVYVEVKLTNETKSTVFYADVNKILREKCPQLLSKYVIVKSTKRSK